MKFKWAIIAHLSDLPDLINANNTPFALHCIVSSNVYIGNTYDLTQLRPVKTAI